ncbi:Protein of unknown function [Pseudonocardia thermophila]|uniref:DUF3500 domain-containing protein n=1 Tax=Pseudonocardia thermophila TaxID=1848 RepID=A0A1M6RY83_PSETH|nr:DUF3500 domain-containing protein [Pseudonocardia thermophila]SHK37492.1 Protein of unknown function [Pseudonocardia thermophila]
MTDSTVDRMVRAATALLDSLDDDQRAAAHFPWPSEEERQRWFYTPTDHGGLPLTRMRPVQQQRTMQLLATGLSRAGYVTAATIMGLENVLDELEGWDVDWGRERGRDPQLYWVAVFGEPSHAGPWSWRFGGHHVSVHHLVVDGRVQASTPCFFGADPAESPLLGGHLLRPLGAAEDLARDLVRSLDEERLARALLTPRAPVDIVSANRSRLSDGDHLLPLADTWRGRFTEQRLIDRVQTMHETAEARAGTCPEDRDAVRYTTVPKGLAARDMTAEQRDQLRALLDVYLRRVPDEIAEREAAKFAGDALLDVHLAWAGGTERGEPHYYRVQGPRLLVEYDNTQRDVNHIHSVWRDPEGDFGFDVLARHLAAHHAG